MERYGMSVRPHHPPESSSNTSEVSTSTQDLDQYTSSSASTTSSSESSSGRSTSPPAHNHLLHPQQPGFITPFGAPQPQFGLQPWAPLPPLPSLWDMDNNNLTSLSDPTWNNNNIQPSVSKTSHIYLFFH